jgi:hypothetical protein
MLLQGSKWGIEEMEQARESVENAKRVFAEHERLMK